MTLIELADAAEAVLEKLPPDGRRHSGHWAQFAEIVRRMRSLQFPGATSRITSLQLHAREFCSGRADYLRVQQLRGLIQQHLHVLRHHIAGRLLPEPML